MLVHQASTEEGIWRVACADMVGLDFPCQGQSTCVRRNQWRRVEEECAALKRCSAVSVNTQKSAVTLKRRHVWSNFASKCRDIQRAGFVANGEVVHCNLTAAKAWSVNACIQEAGYAYQTCPEIEWSPLDADLSRPPLLLTVDNRGTPMIQRQLVSSNRAPAWLRNSINIAAGVSTKATVDWHTMLRQRLVALQRWLESDKRDQSTMVVVIDGHDVRWGGCLDFAQRVERLSRAGGRGIVFGAEFACGEMYTPFPPGCSGTGRRFNASNQTHSQWTRCNGRGMGACSTPPSRRYVNAGAFAGSKHDVLKMLAHINHPKFQSCSRNRAGDINDQSLLNQFANQYPRHTVLDIDATVFLNLYRMKKSAIHFRGMDVIPAWDTSPACFVHNNGMQLVGGSGWT